MLYCNVSVNIYDGVIQGWKNALHFQKGEQGIVLHVYISIKMKYPNKLDTNMIKEMSEIMGISQATFYRLKMQDIEVPVVTQTKKDFYLKAAVKRNMMGLLGV